MYTGCDVLALQKCTSVFVTDAGLEKDATGEYKPKSDMSEKDLDLLCQ